MCLNFSVSRYAFTPIFVFGDDDYDDDNTTLSHFFGEWQNGVLFISLSCSGTHGGLMVSVLVS